jgi:hypothetical protein
MRSGLERQRTRIEQGAIDVEQRQALPFSPAVLEDWPRIAAYFVTRSQPGASVAVQSQRGDPLIAFQRSGLGRVVAVTSGLGPWTARWLQWREWPRLAGGLADWVSSTPGGAALTLAVSDLPAGLQVEGDFRVATDRPEPGGAAIVVDTPTTQGRRVAADPVAPGRLRATLPDDGPGLYTFLATDSQGTRRQLHLRRRRSESEVWGTNPALVTWRDAGLISDWDRRFLAPGDDRNRKHRPVDRSLLGLVLALFLSGVLVDRARLDAASVRGALYRWRARA